MRWLQDAVVPVANTVSIVPKFLFCEQSVEMGDMVAFLVRQVTGKITLHEFERLPESSIA